MEGQRHDEGAVDEGEQGLKLEFRPTSRFADKAVRQPERIRVYENDQPHSTALVDNDYVTKIYRKLEVGINPEVEIGRFLTEVVGFPNSPALLGTAELIEGDKRSAIAVLHAFVVNQFGATNGALADFGMKPRTTKQRTSAQKAETAQKAAATRTARHTVGPRQKAQIHGAPAPTTPDAPKK